MEKYDYRHTIRPNLLFLKLVGLWPIDKCDFYRVYTVIVLICIMGTFDFFRVMNVFYVYTDLKVLTATIYLTVTDVTVLIKSCVFTYNFQTLKQLIIDLNCESFQPKTPNQRDLVKTGLKVWMLSYQVFWVSVFMCLFMWTIGPIVHSRRELPVPAWYPYNITISPHYEITYICQTISIWFLATANMNMDCLIAALMMYIGNQCDILCDDLRNILKNNEKSSTDYNQCLIHCILHHKKILR